MTSLLSFKIDHGNQMIVVGDTCHTYEQSTYEETKLFFFNGLLFCGAGSDRVIQDIKARISTRRQQSACARKILELKLEKIQAYQRLGSGDSYDVEACEFFIIDMDNLRGSKIFRMEITNITDIDLIGSGSTKIGEVQEMLRGCEVTRFDEDRKDFLFRKILEIYLHLGRHDPSTGHPAVFSIDICILEATKEPLHYVVKFQPEIQDIANYSFEVQDD